MTLTRRQFLARTGWVAAGSTVLTSCAWLPVMPTWRDAEASDACLWVQALPDGSIRFFSPKSEMGQGITTGLAQIVAEELNLTTGEIDVVVPHTGQIPPAKMTVGSESIRKLFDPLSNAAALLRETLRERAAARAGVSLDEMADGRGGFIAPGGRQIGYAEIVGVGELIEADADQFARPSRPLRRYSLDCSERSCREVGRRRPTIDIEKIVTGREVYSRDVVVPGMLHGRVLRAPVLRGALGAVASDAARALPGVVDVIVDRGRNRVGVVAADPFVLEAAARAVQVEWSGGESRSQQQLDAELDVDRSIERDEFEHTLLDEGDVIAGAASAARRLSARYDTSFMAHAVMEPRSGIVSVTADGVEAWTASQDPWYMRSVIARTTGRSTDDVVVHNHRIGGAFGGRNLCQATEEAAWLSNVLERPVRVQWTREDEFHCNYFQPPFSHRIDAGVTEAGRISHWQHDYTAGPILTGSTLIPDHLHFVVDLLQDPGSHLNVVPAYDVPNRRIRYSDIRLPVPTGAWRGLGAAPNTTAVEAAMDELAELAGTDPIEFRLAHTSDPRLAAVLRRVAALSNWGAAAAPGHGRGVAATYYENATYVAVVVEVVVDPVSDRVRPLRVWCAHDCGRVINPDQVEAQIEGCIIWGCSMALLERLTLDEGAIGADNFHNYPILRHDDAPEIEIALIEDPRHPPMGAGEPAIAPTPPALLNAVYAATGLRVRQLPVALGLPRARSGAV